MTSLIPDLVRSRNITFNTEQRKNLKEFVTNAVYEANAHAKYAEFSLYRKNIGEKYLNSYSGLSKIALPYLNSDDNKAFNFETTALSGSFSTPYFGQPFDESKFEQQLESEIYIYVSQQISDGGYIVVDIEYDTGEFSTSEYVILREGNQPSEYLDKTGDGHVIKHYERVKYERFTVDNGNSGESNIGKRIYVKYYRNIYDQYLSWKTKRNTGMKVKWHYEPKNELRPDDKFVEDNKLFILLANILHQSNGQTEDIEDLVQAIRKEKQKEKQTRNSEFCRNFENENMILTKYENISMKPIHSGEISEESLEAAASLYHSIVFCPDSDPLIVKFYKNLVEHFPLETILKTLARILLVAKEKELTEHYQTAKAILDKLTTIMNLQYRDIAVMTTGASELRLYQQLNNYHLNNESGREGPDNFQNTENIEGLINHPVHIYDKSGISAFIPFCSFGTELLGKEFSNFQDQFCGLFRVKIVDGQVCYEANVNQFKNNFNWDQTLYRGLSLIIDTSDEYDVKNILERNSSTNEENLQIFDSFKKTEEESSFTIMLKTISKIIFIFQYY